MTVRQAAPARALFAVGLMALVGSGCLAAAGAAGAAGAIAYTERGADTRLDSDIAEITVATESVFSEMGIRITERTTAEDGSRAEFTGTRGELEIQLEAEREDDGLTRIHVTAREALVEYDRDYAEEVLRRIVEAL